MATITSHFGLGVEYGSKKRERQHCFNILSRMPKCCCVENCTNNKRNRQDLNYYIIPKEEKRRRLWLNAISRAQVDESGKVLDKTWSPKSLHNFVCSQHFATGKKEKHPDYIPSVFPGRTKDNSSEMGKMDRVNRRINRALSKEYRFKYQCIQFVGRGRKDSIVYGDVNLRNERDILRAELNLKTTALSYEGLRNNKDKSIKLTGLEFNILDKIISYLKKFSIEVSRSPSLNVEDQILLTIIKLKQNPNFEFLAYIKNIATTTCIECFWKWVNIMYYKLKFLIRMSDREKIFQTIPAVFKQKFPRLTSIIDCFKIFIEAPSNFLARGQCYSQYKKHCTIKVFISVTPVCAALCNLSEKHSS
ncbi:uncharacterized protein LOC130613548 [Hydractinia symbiolongicarpus]|uniref:uncharacterized protein LOC130613548 n=1 Tax=Hydractinia symbiolongicarpus TaxID=13093 RepID=UPI00254D1556|nr:uncharacterized protein LOC130613548 [Hydractinia symbiolongicarpus]